MQTKFFPILSIPFLWNVYQPNWKLISLWYSTFLVTGNSIFYIVRLQTRHPDDINDRINRRYLSVKCSLIHRYLSGFFWQPTYNDKITQTNEPKTLVTIKKKNGSKTKEKRKLLVKQRAFNFRISCRWKIIELQRGDEERKCHNLVTGEKGGTATPRAAPEGREGTWQTVYVVTRTSLEQLWLVILLFNNQNNYLAEIVRAYLTVISYVLWFLIRKPVFIFLANKLSD